MIFAVTGASGAAPDRPLAAPAPSRGAAAAASPVAGAPLGKHCMDFRQIVIGRPCSPNRLPPCPDPMMSVHTECRLIWRYSLADACNLRAASVWL